MPADVFYDSSYQSLYAILIRGNLITQQNPLIYLCTVSGIILVTLGYILYLLKKSLNHFIWATLLLVGLIIYPGMLYHYGVLLLFIIYQFFDEDKPLGFNRYFNVPIVGILYFLSTFSVFSSILFLLFIVILKSLIPMNYTLFNIGKMTLKG